MSPYQRARSGRLRVPEVVGRSAGCPFARVGTSRGARSRPGGHAVAEELRDRLVALVLQRLRAASSASASSVSSATTRVDVAALERVGEAARRSSRSRGRAGSGARSRSAGTRASSVARARCSALLTEASLPSSISATSAARKPSTSRSTSTARWRGGRCCRPVTNASATASWSRSAPRVRARSRHALEQRRPDRAPARSARPGASARAARTRPAAALARPAAAVAQRVQAAVGGDPVQPGAQRRAPSKLLEPAPGGEQRLLQQVLGVLHRAEHAVAVQLELAPVGVGELAKRVLVACAARGVGTSTLIALVGHQVAAQSHRSVLAEPGVDRVGHGKRRRTVRTSNAGSSALALARVASFMVALDALVVTTALPHDPHRPGRVGRAARVDGQRLHPELRRAADDRRGARRPLRPPADVRRRLGAVRARRRPRARSRPTRAR